MWPRGSAPTSAGEVGKTQCCQLLAKLSGQSGGKIRPLWKKFGPLLNLTFWRHLGWWMMKILLSVPTCPGKYNISLICTELERVRGEKLNFKKFGPFSAISVLNWPKFGRSFVRPFYFLFGPFWVMLPNNRPVGKTHHIGEDFDPKVIHGSAIGCEPLIYCFIEKVLIVRVEGGLICFADPLQRWNSWTAFFIEVSGHKLESSQTRVFVWFFTFI